MKAEGDLPGEVEALFEEQSRLVRVTTHPLVTFVLGTAPYTGGLASLLSETMRRRQEARLRGFLISLARSVEDQEGLAANLVDHEFLRSEEFTALVESIMLEASRSADQEKLEYLRRFLIASVSVARPDAKWQDLFLKYVVQLAGVHVLVLRAFFDIQGELPRSDRLGGAEVPGLIPLAVESISVGVPGSDEVLVRIAATDLARFGLLVDWRALRPASTSLEERYCLTDNGKLFMLFLTGGWSTLPGQELRP